jgi:hypothetical protein
LPNSPSPPSAIGLGRWWQSLPYGFSIRLGPVANVAR